MRHARFHRAPRSRYTCRHVPHVFTPHFRLPAPIAMVTGIGRMGPADSRRGRRRRAALQKSHLNKAVIDTMLLMIDNYESRLWGAADFREVIIIY